MVVAVLVVAVLEVVNGLLLQHLVVLVDVGCCNVGSGR